MAFKPSCILLLSLVPVIYAAAAPRTPLFNPDFFASAPGFKSDSSGVFGLQQQQQPQVQQYRQQRQQRLPQQLYRQQQQQQQPPRAEERMSSPPSLKSGGWPSSESHWAGVPTELGASSDWREWGSSAPASSASVEGAPPHEDAFRGGGGLILDGHDEDEGFSYGGGAGGGGGGGGGYDDGRQFKRHITPGGGFAPASNSFERPPAPPSPPRHNSFGGDDDGDSGFKLPQHIQQHTAFQGFGGDSSSSSFGKGFGDVEIDVDDEDDEDVFAPPPPSRPSFGRPPPSSQTREPPSFSRPSEINDAFQTFGQHFKGGISDDGGDSSSSFLPHRGFERDESTHHQGFEDFRSVAGAGGGDEFAAPPPSFQETTLSREPPPGHFSRPPPPSEEDIPSFPPAPAGFGLKTNPDFGSGGERPHFKISSHRPPPPSSGYSSSQDDFEDVENPVYESPRFRESPASVRPPPPSLVSSAPIRPPPGFGSGGGGGGEFSGFGHTFSDKVKFDPVGDFQQQGSSESTGFKPTSNSGSGDFARSSQERYRSPQPVPHSLSSSDAPSSSSPDYNRRPQRHSPPPSSADVPTYRKPSPSSPYGGGDAPNPYYETTSTAPFRPTRPSIRARERQQQPQRQQSQYQERRGGAAASRERPQPSASEYDRVEALGNDVLDEDFREFQSNFEDRERGVDDREDYSHSDKGGKKYEYVMKNYRQPIASVYSKEPEHSVDGYGSSFGALQAYKGGFSSEKYDPKEFAKLDSMVRSPYEEDEELLNDGAEEEDEQEEGGKGVYRQSYMDQRGQGRPEEYRRNPEEYRRDPDEDEEGYFYPREARDDEEQNEEEEEEEEEEEREEEDNRGEREEEHEGRYRPHYEGRGERDMEIQRTHPRDRRQQQQQQQHEQQQKQQKRIRMRRPHQRQQRHYPPPSPMYGSRNEEERAKRLAEKYQQHKQQQQQQQGPYDNWRAGMRGFQ